MAVLAVALLAAVAPVGASAATPRWFYGAQYWGPGCKPPPSIQDCHFSELDGTRLRDSRVGVVRVSFDWAAVEREREPTRGLDPTRGALRDWRVYDSIVGGTARAGASVLATLTTSPPWAAARWSYAPATQEGRDAFRRFARDAAARYGPDGLFWRLNPTLPYRPVRMWQIWNEPNLRSFWGSNPNARNYVSWLLRPVATEIRRVDPAAHIVLAGMPETSGPHRMDRYLESIYRSSRTVKRYFDSVAIHPYSRDYRGVRAGLTRLRRVMARYHDSATPIRITELGWATGNRPSWITVTPAEQARRLRTTFSWLARNRGRYNVRLAIWYSWRDAPSGSAWMTRCGLFDRSNRPKPSYWAFRALTRATR